MDLIPPGMEPQPKVAAKAFIGSIRRRHSVELGYDRESLEWVDRYVEELRARTDLTALKQLAASVAAYLGECFIAAHGGIWTECAADWAVRLENGCVVLPFDAARLQFLYGKAHAVLTYYDTTAATIDLYERAAARVEAETTGE